MKPAPFDYYAPRTLVEAFENVAQLGYSAKVLAGGQSLIPAMNFRLAQPAALVDLNNVAELFYVRPATNGGVTIGAMTRNSVVEHDPLITQRAPLVAEVMPHIAWAQIRNRGTFGGNIAHADPAGHLPAIAVALNGRYHVRSKKADRWLNSDEFFVGAFTTALEPDELLVEVALPPMAPRSGWSYRQAARQAGAEAMVGAAALVSLDERGRCNQARIAYVSVGETPVPAAQAAKTLLGQTPTTAAIQDAAEAAATADVDPGEDIHATADYRRHLVRTLTRQALTEAFERAQRGYSILDIRYSVSGGGDSRANAQYPISNTQSLKAFPISVIVNGVRYERAVEPRLLLSDFIRHELGLTGTHVGCEHGVCGTCTVLFDGQAIRSCLTFAVQAHGHDIRTVEGLGTIDKLHPLQEAFRDKHALQCGFCTPGFLMTLAPFLEQNPNPTEQEIREAISGNLCRCTGYQHIVEAVKLAAERMQK
ncbi:MAG: FAD binding domain-containing protein [Chloroflexi bacterium]|nr:FAD binding domain-containing protein [Chloroflexota bacterium]